MDTNAVNKYLDMFQRSVIDPVLNGPPWVAVAVVCLMAGMILKRLPDRFFPNQAIPPFVWLLGGALHMLFGPVAPDLAVARTWRLRNFTIGLLAGLAATLFHRYGVKPAWRLAKAKLPWLRDDDDTTLFKYPNPITGRAPEPPTTKGQADATEKEKNPPVGI